VAVQRHSVVPLVVEAALILIRTGLAGSVLTCDIKSGGC
jgi:hypothetical protein